MKIGILGVAGAGKDTFAELFLKHRPEFQLMRFAQPLKKAAEHVFGVDFDDRAVKEVPVEVTRELYDRMVEGAMLCCSDLGFTEQEENEASLYFFEVFQHMDPFVQDEDEMAHISPRLYQQLLGTEVIRKARDSAFVDRVRNQRGDGVIADCRFGNELPAADALVLVVRPSVFPDTRPEHKSEHLAWDLTDLYLDSAYSCLPTGIHVVMNKGSINDLEYEVQSVINRLFIK